MEYCGQPASTLLRIISFPLNNSLVVLITPDGVLNTFEYVYPGSTGGQNHLIPVNPTTDSLTDVINKTVVAINSTNLFGDCRVNEDYIQIDQKSVGSDGNTTATNSTAVVSDFTGGTVGTPATATIQLTTIPPCNSYITLVTPDGILRNFEFVCPGGTPNENNTYIIQIDPLDTLNNIVAKLDTAISDTGLFGPVTHNLTTVYVEQPTIGTSGNTKNPFSSSSGLVLNDFTGGENNPNDRMFGTGGLGDPSDYNNRLNDLLREQARTKAQQAKQLSEEKKKFSERRKKAQDCPSPNPQYRKSPNQRKCPCPTCSALNKVKDKIAGKNYFTIPFTNFKIPRFDHLLENIPTFDQNRREGEKCGACQGSKNIVDVHDDSARYEQAAQKMEQNAGKILNKEAKLGLGGTRTTFIQGSDLLFVGLGFNNNKTYETVPGGTIAPTMKGGKIPQQGATQANAVVGKQGSMAWPQQVGNYTIKCANKFNLLAGAGGITIASPGPLTFSGGITKIIAPQITIGCATGPLALEGDSVNVSGKTIALTPSGGEVFVKGNISNTGNTTVQGHAHMESMSFAKGSCVGITKSTYVAKGNPDVLQTQPATWRGNSVASALLDLQTFTQSIPTDSKTSAFRMLSPKEMANMSDRMSSIAKLSLPWEMPHTGYVLPGTSFKAIGSVPCNWGGRAFGLINAITTNFIPINNFPHVHGIPEMMHSHEILLPDMDYTSHSTEALREKVLNGAHESGVPADPTKDTATRTSEVARTTAEFSAAATMEGTKMMAKARRLFS